MTEQMTSLSDKLETCLKLPIDKLANNTLLMLTGMVCDQKRFFAYDFGENRFVGCKCELDKKQKITLVHRIAKCPETRELSAVKELKNLVGEHEYTEKNRRRHCGQAKTEPENRNTQTTDSACEHNKHLCMSDQHQRNCVSASPDTHYQSHEGSRRHYQDERNRS